MNRLRDLRVNHNLTVRDLEKQTKISYSMISRLETESCIFNEQNLKILSTFFNVSIDYLLGLTDIPNYDSKSKQINNPKYDRVFFKITLLSDTDLELIESVIENLLNREKIRYDELYVKRNRTEIK